MPHAPILPGNSARRIALTCSLAFGVVSAPASAQRVTLDVQFKVTDLDNKPLSGVPARLVIEPAARRSLPDAGTRFVTDARGEYRVTTSAVLEPTRIKRPTNFISSLLSGKEPAVALNVAAEMSYMEQYHWLYVFDVNRFTSDGTCLLGTFRVFSRDAGGRFTVEGKEDDFHSWSFPELNGMKLSRAPYEPANFLLEPASDKPNETRWTLHVTWKKSPDAVRR